MTIDIDKLTEAELVDLNRRIVERLRFIQHARAHVGMLRFRIGQRVWFRPEGRAPVVGTLARYNKKSVTVLTADGQRWNVSPALLEPEPEGEPHRARPNLLRLPRKE
jgi:hypothetical protein